MSPSKISQKKKRKINYFGKERCWKSPITSIFSKEILDDVWNASERVPARESFLAMVSLSQDFYNLTQKLSVLVIIFATPGSVSVQFKWQETTQFEARKRISCAREVPSHPPSRSFISIIFFVVFLRVLTPFRWQLLWPDNYFFQFTSVSFRHLVTGFWVFFSPKKGGCSSSSPKKKKKMVRKCF